MHLILSRLGFIAILILGVLPLYAGVTDEVSYPDTMLKFCEDVDAKTPLEWTCLQEPSTRDQAIYVGQNFFWFPKLDLQVNAGEEIEVEFFEESELITRTKAETHLYRERVGFIFEVPNYFATGIPFVIVARLKDGRVFGRILFFAFTGGIVIGNVGDGGSLPSVEDSPVGTSPRPAETKAAPACGRLDSSPDRYSFVIIFVLFLFQILFLRRKAVRL